MTNEQKFEYIKYVYSIVSEYDPQNSYLTHLRDSLYRKTLRDSLYRKTYTNFTEENFNRIHSNFTGGKFPRYEMKTIAAYFRDKKIDVILDQPQA